MQSSNRHPRLVLAVVFAMAAVGFARKARAQQAYRGFAVERLYPSAPGAGWFAVDALDMRGGIGGALSITSGYARNPLRLANGAQTLAVVSDQAFTEIGVAVAYNRMRLSIHFTTPVLITGESGMAGGFPAVAPRVNLGNNPDTLSDVRIGFDARILGPTAGAFRLGGGAMLIVPSGNVADYDTDGTVRGVLRLHVAGDVGPFTYAANVGVHLRPRDDGSAPEAPRGEEFLFAIAAGGRVSLGNHAAYNVIVGPEVYGATALRSMFDTTATALEGLLGARLEGTGRRGMQLRFRAGIGAGLIPHFGAAEWRAVLGVEMFNRDLVP